MEQSFLYKPMKFTVFFLQVLRLWTKIILPILFIALLINAPLLLYFKFTNWKPLTFFVPLIYFLNIFSSFLIPAIIYRAALDLCQNRPILWKTVISQVLRKGLRFVGISITISLFIAIPCILFCLFILFLETSPDINSIKNPYFLAIPLTALFFMAFSIILIVINYCFAIPIWFNEGGLTNSGPPQCLARSRQLAKGAKWRIFLYLLFGPLMVIFFIVILFFWALETLKIKGTLSPTSMFIFTKITTLFLESLPIIAVTLLYLDQRARKECAADLESNLEISD